MTQNNQLAIVGRQRSDYRLDLAPAFLAFALLLGTETAALDGQIKLVAFGAYDERLFAGSGAPQMIDDLRYGAAATGSSAGIANADEYAFVKIRYKLPDGDVSKLLTTPVTDADAVASFDAADTDRRFSVAVAAFGQKLRDGDQLASFGYDRILEIAAAARGADPFGYRSEFLSLVRLAAALSEGGR